ncbi:LANO_0A05050g1_1 [Lachancea nothofagi CBS 11611]|uniref:2'-phosphotransferase n=1 Tax=Lachancea nothofagi CBS 11611 TaxID=1266666 RepID=A0A1G4IQU3_9SACH|nr:LANO_0A05050g1_1 [Lachancea nothofagi CBS 11611]
MTEDKRDVHISKSLAYLLRHGAVKEGLDIDSNGYILVDVLLQHNRLKSLHCTLQDVDRVVANNAKKRFHIKTQEGHSLICATQGHSIDAIAPADEVLQKVSDFKQMPSMLVHGTTLNNLKLIIQTGCIKKMRRNQIHLAPGVTGVDEGVVSGMRISSNVYIYLKPDEAHKTLEVFRSMNDVYLTPDEIPLELFEKVVLRENAKNKSAVNEARQLLENRNIPCFTVSHGDQC